MKKMFVPAFAFRLFLSALSIVFSLTSAFAQVDIAIGTGTVGNTGTTYPCPIQDWYEGSRAQYLYTAAELQAAGMGPGAILGIRYNVVSVGAAGVSEQHTVRIGGTNIATLDLASWAGGTTQVWGPVNYQPVAGLNTFNFSTSYFWNGTDNIIVETCGGDPNSNSGITYTENCIIPWTTGLAFNGSHTYRNDNQDNLCGTTNVTNSGTGTTRPNIIFIWVSANACSGVPNPGVAAASVNNACLGIPFNLSLSGQTLASGMTYQWQVSTDNVNFTDIPGATTTFATVSQSVTSWYRCVVTCTNAGGGSAFTNSVSVFSPTLVGGTFTINNLLPTGGTNFASFNDAYDYIKCGINAPVVFNVVGGTGPYNEQLIMSPVPGASIVNTITFNGNGSTIQYLSSNTNERATIKLRGADYIRFNDLIITALGATNTEYGYGVHLLNSADSNIFNNCTINLNQTSSSTNYAGIVINSNDGSATATGAALCDFNLFTSNTVSGGYYGICMVGSTNDANGSNTFINNSLLDYYQYGFYVLGSFSTLIEGNIFSRPTRAVVGPFYGLYFTGLSVAANINRNRIFNPYGGISTATTAAYGIYFTGNDGFAGLENKVTNNLIYNFTGNGDVYGIYNSSSDNMLMYHNTISIDGDATNTTGANVSRGFYQTLTAAGVEFRNNIISLTRGGGSIKTAVYFNTNTSTILSNFNDYYLNAVGGLSYVGFFNATQLTLADWQAASLQDANSITSNPQFASALSGNFKPTNSSINDLGTPVNILDDIDGNARSTTAPDMGAYEFTPQPCNNPIGGNALVSPSPVCQGAYVNLALANNSTGLGQVYQWQSSTSPSGPFTNLGGPLTNPDTLIIAPGVSTYYTVAITCGSQIASAAPVLLSVNPSLPAGTYTVNSALPTGGTNYNSFAAVRSALECGILGPVVFDVVAGSGPYNEQVVFDSVRGASIVNTITFNGNGNALRYAPVINDERAVLKLRRADFFRFNNLVIDATVTGSSYGYGVQLINNADSNIFSNCTIKSLIDTNSTFYAGVVINAAESGATTTGNTLCDGNLFIGNTISGGYYGVTLVGSTTVANRSNTFLNNAVRDFHNYGFYVFGSFDTRIEANDISRPNRTIAATFYGVYFTGLSVGANITRNRIHNPYDLAVGSNFAAFGIYFTGNDAFTGLENRITNNLIYNMNAPTDVYGIYNTSSDNAFYYHNTISLDDVASVSTGVCRGFYQTTAASNIEFKNNIVTITRGGAGQKHAMYFATQGSQIASNNNDFYVNATAGVNGVGFFNGGNRATLADWQGFSGQDANSVDFNPEYTNPAAGDYTPLMTAMDNLGTPVGVSNDILDVSRSATTPDVGAYEFTIPPCTAPPVAGTTVVDPPSGICIGVTVKLDLAGNSIGSGQTFQWESSPNGTTWTPISPVQFIARFFWTMTTETYFRCKITCSGNSVYSSVFQVNLNPPLPPGYYTINPNLPAALPNFQSFTAAVAALECGIGGHVYFDAADGVYNEQIRMHRIGGAGPNARVTFRSASGNPASVTLTYASTTAALNYTLQLDSASYVTYANMSIAAQDATNGRVVQLAHSASFDSIYNCNIVAPVAASTNTTSVGIYADQLSGQRNSIIKNRIQDGSYGIYYQGIAALDPTKDHIIDSNLVFGMFSYGIYAGNSSRIKLTNNNVLMDAPMANNAYGIYCNNCDSGYLVKGNKVSIDNSTSGSSYYGMYLNQSDSKLTEYATVTSNTIIAGDVNDGNVYGMYQSQCGYNNTVNNVIRVYSTAGTSYGLYSISNFRCNYYNNTVSNSSVPATGSFTATSAAYFSHSSANAGRVNIKNNIFSHTGGGTAMYILNNNFLYSDYNLLYSTGAALVRRSGTVSYATLQDWINASFWDVNSIVYRPTFVSSTDLRPDLASPEVWAMHGRGEQIQGNNYDFNGNPRPTTLTTGVPDMGAYEFLPTSLPTILTATTAPAPGTTQVFMYGTDTVIKVTYAPGSTVPSDLTFRRYSGVIPPGLSPTQKSMYFYTEAQVTGSMPTNYSVKKYYIDPWQGFIPDQQYTKLGRTIPAGNWVANSNSQVDATLNFITDTALNYMDKFTGLADSNLVIPPVVLPPADSSNQGRVFWVGYGHHYGFEAGNDQDMKIYLSAEQDAYATITINGTPYSRTYFVPAGTVVASDPLPKTGVYDSRLLEDGKSNKGIKIESDVPIVAYAHIYASTTSEAAMLLPVGTYGYEYTALTTEQEYTTFTYSWAYCIAEVDSTVVEITPSNPTLTGRPARVPFTVTLNKGEVYQVLGALIQGSVGYDLTGTTFRSRPNSQGKCYPIAVFSGSSRTNIDCAGTDAAGSGDNIFEQNFPYVAWGKKYLTSPTSSSSAANSLQTNIFRVAVKDTSTIVTRNGVQLTNLINGFYYEYESGTADVIQANKPVIVAQIMSSAGYCPNTSGAGDPAMIYVSPVEQGIKRVGLYRTTQSAITHQYVTLIIPNGGLPSLTIDGSNVFDYTYVHPNDPNYTVVVKRWNPASSAQVIVQSDSAFTCITYGLGSVESYGYNGGTLVKNLNALPSLTNTLGTGTATNYTCVKAPFVLSIRINLLPTQMEWQLSQVPGINPDTNVTLINPVPLDTTEVNGTLYYNYSLPGTYTFTQPGLISIPIVLTSPTIEGCNNSLEVTLPVTVLPAPSADFTNQLEGCTGQTMTFNGSGNTTNGQPIENWSWDFSDPPTDTLQNTSHVFNAPGNYNVKLTFVAADGCIGDTVKVVKIYDYPVVALNPDSLSVCPQGDTTFQIQNPGTGVTYNWYNTLTGGTPVNSGTSYNVSDNGSANTYNYYVEGVNGPCASTSRTKVTLTVVQPLASIVVGADSIGTDYVVFGWNAVPGAVGYEVSTDNATWTTPSSGPTGLTHRISGLQQNASVILYVRALGTVPCQNTGDSASAITLANIQIFIPNAFSPNGDGVNDYMQVYGTIRSLRFMVFNQWGEKISESTNANNVWDGRHRGKLQPSGVYMYVCELIMIDGTKILKKGAINLIR